jgi:hypothetical protein
MAYKVKETTYGLPSFAWRKTVDFINDLGA